MLQGCIKYLFIFCVICGNLSYLNINKPVEASPLAVKCVESENLENSEPDCVYLADTRNPKEIFETGFQIPGEGTDENILDHITGRSTLGNTFGDSLEKTTNFVSTTEKIVVAEDGIKNSRKQKWLYFIEPDENFFSVNKSLEKVLENNESNKEFRASIDMVYKNYRYQFDWLAKGGIPKERIISAVPYIFDPHTFNNIPDYSKQKINEHFKPSKNKANLHPLPISESTKCVICTVRIPKTLQEIHLKNFDKTLKVDLEKINFTTNVNFVDGIQGRLLSPFEESNKLLNSFDPISGISGYEQLNPTLRYEMLNDLNKLKEISADPNLVEKTMREYNRRNPGKKIINILGSRIPYLGIVVNGYSVYKDLEAEEWSDSVFDFLSLGVSVYTLVEGAGSAPEGQPLLAVIDVAKETARAIQASKLSKIHPGFTSDIAEGILEKWNQLPDTIVDMAKKESKEQILTVVEKAKNESILPYLSKSLYKDFVVLDEIQKSYMQKITFNALAVVKGKTVGKQWEKVDGIRKEILANIQKIFFDLQNELIENSAVLLQEYTKEFAKNYIQQYWQTGQLGNEIFLENFDKEVALPYVAEIENILHKIYEDVPNLLSEVYLNKNSSQLREDKRLEYRNKFANTLFNLDQHIAPFINTEEDLNLLEEKIFLNLEEHEPDKSSVSMFMNVGNVLCFYISPNGVLQNNSCIKKSVHNKAFFAKAGKIKISVYDKHKYIKQTYDVTNLDFTTSKVIQDFYNIIGVLEEREFLVLEFENPVSFVESGENSGLPQSRLENTTQYVTQVIENKFVPWLSNKLFTSENMQTFRIKSANYAKFFTLEEEHIRGKVSNLENFDVKQAQDWNFVYQKETGFYTISSFLNPKLFLCINNLGIAIVDEFVSKESAQLWNVQRDHAKHNFITISNVAQQQTSLVAAANGSEIKTNPVTENVGQQFWVLESIDNNFLDDGNYALEFYASQHRGLKVDFQSTKLASTVLNGQNLEKFNFSYHKSRNAYTIKAVSANNSTKKNGKSYLLTLGDDLEDNLSLSGTRYSDEQFWVIERNSDGYFTIRNYKYRNMFLAFSLKNNQIFAEPFQAGDSEQIWDLLPTNFRPIADGRYRVSSNLGLRYVFDYVKIDNKLEMWGRNYGKNQQWYFEYDQNKQAYRVSSIFDPEMRWFWDKNSNSLKLSKQDSAETWWCINSDVTGLVTFRSYANDEFTLDKVLTVLPANKEQLADGSTFNMSPVDEDKIYQNTTTQKFVLESMEPIRGLADNLFNLQPVLHEELLLTMTNNEDRGAIYLHEKTADLVENQKVLFTYNNEVKAYRINFPVLGKNFTWNGIDNGGLLFGHHNDDGAGDHFWDVVENIDGNVRITNRSRPYLGVLQALNYKNGSNIGGVYAVSSDQNQLWSLEPIHKP